MAGQLHLSGAISAPSPSASPALHLTRRAFRAASSTILTPLSDLTA